MELYISKQAGKHYHHHRWDQRNLWDHSHRCYCRCCHLDRCSVHDRCPGSDRCWDHTQDWSLQVQLGAVTTRGCAGVINIYIYGDSHITARCGPFLKTLSNFVLIVITRGDYMWGLIKTKRGARKKENKSTFSTRLYFLTPSSEGFKCTIILVQPGKKTESYRHSQTQLQSLVPMLLIWGPLILLLVPGWQGSLGNQSWTLSAWVVSRT